MLPFANECILEFETHGFSECIPDTRLVYWCNHQERRWYFKFSECFRSWYVQVTAAINSLKLIDDLPMPPGVAWSPDMDMLDWLGLFFGFQVWLILVTKSLFNYRSSPGKKWSSNKQALILSFTEQIIHSICNYGNFFSVLPTVFSVVIELFSAVSTREQADNARNQREHLVLLLANGMMQIYAADPTPTVRTVDLHYLLRIWNSIIALHRLKH